MQLASGEIDAALKTVIHTQRMLHQDATMQHMLGPHVLPKVVAPGGDVASETAARNTC